MSLGVLSEALVQLRRLHLGMSTFDNLHVLREAAERLGGIQHVVDDTVVVSAYRSLVEAILTPDYKRPAETAIGVGPGKSLELRFKDPVVGFGVYYKQGLYPSSFTIYYVDGRQKRFIGKGYFPETEFIGDVSATLIERVIIEPQSMGNVVITGMYLFPRNEHRPL